ncbi:TetR/AcrR family transcriptional regulator [Gordonia sp. (in: high G+C Gram-positive bacteria)]|uniref:TetR/AcrR family transcriptional regulator n=1 Tax=Gordonia sp. (in: high G+C Gram-positive bacteria) TaxID=84139 RepID=UPI003C784A67
MKPVGGKSERTRSAVRAAAAACFADSGFQAATTAEIARRAGVSEGTVFVHYASKLGLLTAVTVDFYEAIQQRGATVVADSEATPTERLRRLVHDWCEVMTREWPLVQVFIHTAQAFPGTELATVVIESNRQYTRLYAAVIDEMKAAGEMDPALPTALVRDMIFGTLEHSARGQMYAGRTVHTAGVGRQIVDLVIGTGKASDNRLATIESKIDRLLELQDR